jgi:hypothetical protein
MTARWLTILGSLVAIGGIVIIAAPPAFTAWMLLLISALHLAIAWPFRGTRASVWQVLVAIATGGLGLYLLGRGAASPETIRPASMIGLLAIAVLEAIVFRRAAGWARRILFLVSAGAAALVAGLVWIADPVMFLGVSVLFSGIARAAVTTPVRPQLPT